jgi:hypothetical protein
LVALPIAKGAAFGFSTSNGPYVDSYWDDLLGQAPGRDVILFWLGSQHLADFLFEADPVFDLILADRPDLPLEQGATLLPEGLVREYEKTFLGGLEKSIDRLKREPDCRVFVAATTPPKGDDDELRALMMAEPFFQDRAKRFGLDITNVRFTPRFVRLKLWLVIQQLMREMADKHGVYFIPPHPSTLDADGFLRREYWENDVGHANHAYGRLFFDFILEKTGHRHVAASVSGR